MFDLDRAVATWRIQLAKAGVDDPAVLDELEGHLREDFARETQSGLEASQAFALVVQRIGSGPALKVEFEKTDERYLLFVYLKRGFYWAFLLAVFWSASDIIFYVREKVVHGPDHHIRSFGSLIPVALGLCLFLSFFLVVRLFNIWDRKMLRGIFVCCLLFLLMATGLIIGVCSTLAAGLSVYDEYIGYVYKNGGVKTLLSLLI